MNKLQQLLCLGLLIPVGSIQAQDQLGAARYTAEGELMFPGNTDEWIFLGSSLGSDYGEGPFDPANPGTIGVVQMEPAAYRYFLENREYADGTMMLLTFYASDAQSSPQLPGFVQGQKTAKEIHLIDKSRFDEGRGFFLYPTEASPGAASGKLPDNSTCIQCHISEGEFDGTFTQFYPTIRDLVVQ